MRLLSCALSFLICAATPVFAAEATATPITYERVQSIFDDHCLDCHEAQDPEANLVLESFATLMKGGESGAAVVAGKAGESLLVRMVEGTLEKDGKKKIMPPGKKKKLSASEIAAIRSWIDSGAPAPQSEQTVVRNLVVPKIAPKKEPRNPINALAYSAANHLIAAARYGEVDTISAGTGKIVRRLAGHRGAVNAVAFTADGAQLFAASGENGLFGEVKQWRVEDGSVIRVFNGHRDAIYSLAISPDGKILATGSYDQKIKLWDVASGKELKTLSGHNGAVFGLAFRPDGKVLASASGDRTVKLWDVAKGERADTLSQTLKDVYAVAFSADGKKLFAGGMDNRIRVWAISESAAEGTNPALEARFAHEGSILRLVFSSDGKLLLSSADDRTVKVWDATNLKEKLLLETQPDWASGLAFVGNGKRIAVGRLDGSLNFYDSTSGKLISTNFASASVSSEILK